MAEDYTAMLPEKSRTAGRGSAAGKKLSSVSRRSTARFLSAGKNGHSWRAAENQCRELLVKIEPFPGYSPIICPELLEFKYIRFHFGKDTEGIF